MRKGCVFFLFIFMSLSSSHVSALGGYLGENPGLDFYSKIDDNAYAIEKRLVTGKLRESPRLDSFAKSCSPKVKRYLAGKNTDETLLRDLQNQYYGGLSRLLANESSVTTDEFAELARCLADSYSSVQNRVRSEQGRREITSQAGLYSDGDTGNSEYDIISDIQRINSIIFSTPIPYTGTRNTSSNSLASILSGNNPRDSMPASLLAFLGGDNPTGEDTPPNPDAPAPPGEAGVDLSELIGTTCSDPTSVSGPVDSIADEGFALELASVLGGGDPLSLGGYSASTRPNSTTAQRAGSLTGAPDFFDRMPCGPGQMFCIDVRVVPGGNISLGGGRSYSIESVMDKYSRHLYPISESDLSYKRMTNQHAQSMETSAKFTIVGLRTYLGEKGQRSRTDRNEETPARTEDKLQAMLDCASIISGLPVNAKEANTLGSAGFRLTASTTDRQVQQTQPTRVQDMVAALAQMKCYQNYMNEGRRIYANSLSQDITDLQAFTDGMLTEIQDIMRLLTAMNNKDEK